MKDATKATNKVLAEILKGGGEMMLADIPGSLFARVMIEAAARLAKMADAKAARAAP